MAGRPRASGAGTGAGTRSAGAVPGAALGTVRAGPYQAGRQGRPSTPSDRARAMLGDELGLDPGLSSSSSSRRSSARTPRCGLTCATPAPSARIAGCWRTRARTPSVLRREANVAASCSGWTLGWWPSWVRRASGSRPSSEPEWSLARSRRGAGPGDHARERIPPASVRVPPRPPDPGGGPGRGGGDACRDSAEREPYFATLAAHEGAGGGLVISLRADRLGDLAPYPEFARVLEKGLYLLAPMSEQNLRARSKDPPVAGVSGSSRAWWTSWSVRWRVSRPRCRCCRTSCERPGSDVRSRP